MIPCAHKTSSLKREERNRTIQASVDIQPRKERREKQNNPGICHHIVGHSTVGHSTAGFNHSPQADVRNRIMMSVCLQDVLRQIAGILQIL
jgi:hypothetical protein